MRIYYIFLIKKEIYGLTKNKPENLYKILETIYLLNNDDVVLTTKLIINNSHIKIKSNNLYPSFFKNLENIPYLFVCDFINMDYFFLKSVSSKNCTR